MNIVKKLSVFILAFILLGGIVFGATVTLSPSNVPKGAYVNGSDGDQYFFQSLNITLEADGTDGWANGDDIVIDLPSDFEIADIDEDGSYSDEVAVSYRYGSASNITLTVSAVTISKITLDLAGGANVMAGDKINVFFPITTPESPSGATADYTVRYYDLSETNYADLEDDGDNTVTATYVDSFSLVTFSADYSGGDQTSEKGKVYPASASPVTSALTDYVNDFATPDAGTEYLSNTGDFSSNWTNAGGFAIDATDASYTFAGANTGSITQATADMATTPVGSVRYRFYYEATVNTNLTLNNIQLTNSFATSAVDLIAITDAAASYSRYVYFTSQATPGDFVISTAGATGQGDVDFDNFELIRVGDEVLTNTEAFAANWVAANGIGIVANAINYTDNASGGTLTHASANFAVTPSGGETYVFTYEVTDITDDYVGTATITTDFAATAQTLDLASTGAKEVIFTSAATPGDFVLDFQNDDTDDSDDITIDNFALYKLGTNGVITSNLLASAKLDGTSDTDDMQYYLWASQTPNLTKVDEQFGHRPIAAATSDSNTVDNPVGFVNETATFAGTQLDGRLLEEGTWYFYATSDLTADWVLGSSDSLDVQHHPVFNAYDDATIAGGVLDYDEDGEFELNSGHGVPAEDNRTAMYLESGGGVGKDGSWGGTNTDNVNMHWSVEDVDDNANVKIYLNPTSSTITTQTALLADTTTIQISPDTLYEEGPTSDSWNYDIYESITSYAPANDYYVYMVADDGKNSNVYKVRNNAGSDLILYVKHYPNLQFQDVDYLHDENTVDADIDFNTANQQYLTINWGETIDGDKDADGNQKIKLYVSQIANGSSGYSGTVSSVDTTLLANDAINNPTQTVHVATIVDTADGRDNNRYMFDMRNSGLEAGTYYVYAVITENGDAQVIQMNDSGADDRPITLTHGEYVLPVNPPEGEIVNLATTDRFEFKWNAFDKDATATNFVNAYFMVKDGYEQMIDDLEGNWDIGEIDDGAFNFLSEGDFTTVAKWTGGTSYTLTGGNAAFLDASGAAATLLLTQAEADIKYAVEGATQYVLEYTVSGVADAPTAQITTSFANVNTALTLTAGEQQTTFTTANNPGDFVIQVTSADAPDAFTLDDVRLYKAGVAHWLTGSSDGDDLPTVAGTQMSADKVIVDFDDIDEDMEGGTVTPSGEYHVYMIWADDANLDDDDAETIVKADGMLTFNSDVDPATSFEISPNRMTAEKGDTLSMDIYATDGGVENASIISVFLNIENADRFTVVDQNDANSGIQPWLDESTNFNGTGYIDTLRTVDSNYEIDYVEFVNGGTAIATSSKIGTIQLIANENFTGDALEKVTVTFNATGSRITSISGANGNKLATTVPEVGATIEFATPGTISGHVEMEGRDPEGEVVDIYVCPEGSIEQITDADFLTANGLGASDTLHVTLGAGGAYSILRVPTGTYDVIVEKAGFLSQRIASQTVNPLSVTNVDFEGSNELLVGDCAGYTTPEGTSVPDNQIGTDDLNAISSAFNTSAGDANWNQYADCDADGTVGPNDLVFVTQNNLVSGEALLYKQVNYEDDNLNTSITFVKEDNGKYVVKASGLAHICGYGVQLSLNPDDYVVENYVDGLSSQKQTYHFTKQENNTLFLVSGVYGKNTVVQSEINLCELTLTKKYDSAPEPEVIDVVIIGANNSQAKGIISNSITELPTEFSLSKNYPNPFNPTTNIKYALPDPGNVRLIVYDILGKKVRTLVASEMKAGNYHAMWNATNEAGLKVSSGVYLYRLVVDNKVVDTKKMVLMK